MESLVNMRPPVDPVRYIGGCTTHFCQARIGGSIGPVSVCGSVSSLSPPCTPVLGCLTTIRVCDWRCSRSAWLIAPAFSLSADVCPCSLFVFFASWVVFTSHFSGARRGLSFCFYSKSMNTWSLTAKVFIPLDLFLVCHVATTNCKSISMGFHIIILPKVVHYDL